MDLKRWNLFAFKIILCPEINWNYNSLTNHFMRLRLDLDCLHSPQKSCLYQCQDIGTCYMNDTFETKRERARHLKVFFVWTAVLIRERWSYSTFIIRFLFSYKVGHEWLFKILMNLMSVNWYFFHVWSLSETFLSIYFLF